MEIIDLYDARKNKLNKKIDRETGDIKEGEYKQSVHVWIINDNKQFLIEKRSHSMKINPDKWAFVGGVVEQGENSLDGAIRETKEELGIEINPIDFELIISFKRKVDFVDVWIAFKNCNIEKLKLQKVEVQDAKWVNIDELEELIKNNEFVPAINLYYDFFKEMLKTFY